MRFWGIDANPAPLVKQELEQVEQHRPFPFALALGLGLATIGFSALAVIAACWPY